MKTLLEQSASSIVRFLLVAYGGFLATHSGVEIATDPDAVSVAQLIMGTVLALLSIALKKVDAWGDYGKLASTFIGPRVKNIAWSISRWIVGLAGGAVTAWFATQGQPLESGLGDASLSGIVVLLVSFLYDRISKLFRP